MADIYRCRKCGEIWNDVTANCEVCALFNEAGERYLDEANAQAPQPGTADATHGGRVEALSAAPYIPPHDEAPRPMDFSLDPEPGAAEVDTEVRTPAGETQPHESATGARQPANDVETPPLPQQQDGQSVNEKIRQLLEECEKEDVPVIVLLGFPAAGKTFFLNRFKYEIAEQGDTPETQKLGYESVPPYAPGGTTVRATKDLSLHVFRKKKACTFAIVDIPGEIFNYLMTNTAESDTRLPILKQALNMAFGLVLLLPAEELAFCRMEPSFQDADGLLPWIAAHYPDAYRQVTGMQPGDAVQRLLDHIATLDRDTLAPNADEVHVQVQAEQVAVTALTEGLSGKVPPELEALILPVTPDERKLLAETISRLADYPRAAGEFHTFMSSVSMIPKLRPEAHTTLPAYIALSKADRLKSHVKNRDKALHSAILSLDDAARRVLDAGPNPPPLDLVREAQKGMLNRMINSFGHCECGFLSAFENLDLEKKKHRIKYRTDKFGVIEVIEWIFKKAEIERREAEIREKEKSGPFPLAASRVFDLFNRLSTTDKIVDDSISGPERTKSKSKARK